MISDSEDLLCDKSLSLFLLCVFHKENAALRIRDFF